MHGWMRVNTTMKDKHLYLVDAACQHKGCPEIQQPRVWCKSPPPPDFTPLHQCRQWCSRAFRDGVEAV